MRHDLSILQLRYTKAQFAASNPTPSSGQLCIETDSGVYTTGDGSSAYLTIRGNSDLSGLDRTSADDVYAMMSLGDSRDEVGDGSAEMIPFVIINSGDIKAAYRYYDISLTKPRYVQVIPGTTQAASAAASNFLFWGGDNKWHVWGNGGGEYHTSTDAVATPDLVTTWVLANGAVAPLPTVEPYYGTQQEFDEVLAALITTIRNNKFMCTLYQEDVEAPYVADIIRQGPILSVVFSYNGIGQYTGVITPSLPTGAVAYWQGTDPYFEKGITVVASGAELSIISYNNGSNSNDILPEIPGFLVIEFP